MTPDEQRAFEGLAARVLAGREQMEHTREVVRERNKAGEPMVYLPVIPIAVDGKELVAMMQRLRDKYPWLTSFRAHGRDWIPTVDDAYQVVGFTTQKVET